MSKTKSLKPVTVYVDKKNTEFKVGDRVRLKAGTMNLYKKTEGETLVGLPITETRIRSLFNDVKGLVLLEARLGGYWTWDVNELEKVE